MKRASGTLVFGLALGAMLAWSASAMAWETITCEKNNQCTLDGHEDGWQSVYIVGPKPQSLPAKEGWSGNEHAEFSHLALAELGLADELGMNGDCWVKVVDLNATLSNPAVKGLSKRGDEKSTLLEERCLPRPAHFSGLADFNYTLYDWIGKSTRCPTLAAGEVTLEEDCHRFAVKLPIAARPGWLGILNANHFGSQARNMYMHFHRLAVSRGEAAHALRQQVSTAGALSDVHEPYVLELEAEALAYEGFAQHFLQDRWSIGHMWERWGSSDLEQMRDGKDKPVLASKIESEQIYREATVAALVAGTIHGTEPVFGTPDAMCSPTVPAAWYSALVPAANGVAPVDYTHRQGGPLGGVGDDRLEDMHDGIFSYGGKDYLLAVDQQRQQMMACSGAGWSEVVAAFGPGDGAGTYGARALPLADPGAGPDLTQEAPCWDAWATNRAMARGLLDQNTGLAQAIKLAGLGSSTLQALGTVFGIPRTGLGALAFKMKKLRKRDAGTGTSIAEGEDLPSLKTMRNGRYYAFDKDGQPRLPSWVEPSDLDTLPPTDILGHGRDKDTLFGFFNKAHVDWWCEGIETRLSGLKELGGAEYLEACEYLAERVYKGTDPGYNGVQAETLRDADDNDVDPICSFFGVETEGVEHALPFYLHPGYVPDGSPGARSTAGHATASIANWCAGVPVVDLTPTIDGVSADDHVGTYQGSGELRDVTLTGQDFGAVMGQVLIDSTASSAVQSWSATEIVMSYPESIYGIGDRFVEVVRSDGTSSVGRFVLAPPALSLDSVSSTCTAPTSAITLTVSGVETMGLTQPLLATLSVWFLDGFGVPQAGFVSVTVITDATSGTVEITVEVPDTDDTQGCSLAPTWSLFVSQTLATEVLESDSVPFTPKTESTGIWRVMDNPTGAGLIRIWGRDADTVFASGASVGGAGVVLRLDGESWVEMDSGGAYFTAFADAAAGVFASDGGGIYKLEGGQWVTLPEWQATSILQPGVGINDIERGPSGSLLVATGPQNGLFSKLSGQPWRPHCGSPLSPSRLSSNGGGYFVGPSWISRYYPELDPGNGICDIPDVHPGFWEDVDYYHYANATGDGWEMWASAADEVFVVGINGTWVNDGSDAFAWQQVGTYVANDLWGTPGADTIYLVGSQADGDSGKVVALQPGAGTETEETIDSADVPTLVDVWCADSATAFAVGGEYILTNMP